MPEGGWAEDAEAGIVCDNCNYGRPAPAGGWGAP